MSSLSEQLMELSGLLNKEKPALSLALLTAARTISNLTTQLAAAKDRVVELERENSALAADQCHAGYAGEYGHHRCREVDAARAAAEEAMP